MNSGKAPWKNSIGQGEKDGLRESVTGRARRKYRRGGRLRVRDSGDGMCKITLDGSGDGNG